MNAVVRRDPWYSVYVVLRTCEVIVRLVTAQVIKTLKLYVFEATVPGKLEETTVTVNG